MPEPESQEGLLRELAGRGVEREEIDIVLLTHVHIDHVGWNAQDDGSATFPRARYLLHEDALAAARRRADRPHIGRCVLGLERSPRDGHGWAGDRSRACRSSTCRAMTTVTSACSWATTR